MSAHLVNRSKVQREPPSLIFAVAHAKDDDVALISLNVLEVLDEATMEPIPFQHRPEFGAGLGLPQYFILDRARLRLRKGHDPNRKMRMGLKMEKHAFHNFRSFDRIVSRATATLK